MKLHGIISLDDTKLIQIQRKCYMSNTCSYVFEEGLKFPKTISLYLMSRTALKAKIFEFFLLHCALYIPFWDANSNSNKILIRQRELLKYTHTHSLSTCIGDYKVQSSFEVSKFLGYQIT